MTSPKITGFIIALILISSVTGSIIIIMNAFGEGYSLTYDNSSMESISSQMSDINGIVNKTKQTAEDLTVDSSWTDVLGAYLSGAYNSLKISMQSMGVFYNMVNAMDDSFSVPGYTLLKAALISIVVILIFVGILVAAVVQRDL